MVNVTRLSTDRFRFIGAPEVSGWKPAGERSPWCEVTLDVDSGAVRSFGGTVWPSAWPSLFEALPSSPALGSCGFRLTDAGLALVRAAVAGEPEQNPMAGTIYYLREAAERLQAAARLLESRCAWHLHHARGNAELAVKDVELVIRQLDRAQMEQDARRTR